MHKPPQPIENGATFNLTAIEQEMQGEVLYEERGHNARTLVQAPDLRVLLIVMRSGAEIQEHRANETASVHVLSGHLRLQLPGRTVELNHGQLLVLEPELRHSIEAIEKSAFLLTLGWSK